MRSTHASSLANSSLANMWDKNADGKTKSFELAFSCNF